MTRLLQYVFTPERSFFVVVLRHPYATMHDMWEKADEYQFDDVYLYCKRENIVSFCRFGDCGEAALKHWLLITTAMFFDLKHIKNKVVFHYERFVQGDSQGGHKLYILRSSQLNVVTFSVFRRHSEGAGAEHKRPNRLCPSAARKIRGYRHRSSPTQ